MRWILVGLAVTIVILFALPLRQSVLRVRKIFGSPHLIELAEKLSSARLEAVKLKGRTSEAIHFPGDPRVFITSGPLAVAYTITSRGGQFAHHWSISVAGYNTPVAVSGRMAVYVGLLLGFEPEDVSFSVSKRGIGHATALLGPEQESQLESRRLGVPSADEAAHLFQRGSAYFTEHHPEVRDWPEGPDE
jgi:hypothetical protein